MLYYANITKTAIKVFTAVLFGKSLLEVIFEVLRKIFPSKKYIRLLVIGHQGAGKTTFLDLIRGEKRGYEGQTDFTGEKLSAKDIGEGIILKEMTDIAGEKSINAYIETSNADVVVCLFDYSKFLEGYEHEPSIDASAELFKCIADHSKKRNNKILCIASHVDEKTETVKVRKKVIETLEKRKYKGASSFIKECDLLSLNLTENSNRNIMKIIQAFEGKK